MKIDKIANIIIATTFCAVIFMMGVFSLLLPKPEVSEIEKKRTCKNAKFYITIAA